MANSEPKNKPRISTKLRKAKMLQALEKTLGVVTSAAKLVGIHRQTHHHWLKTDEKYKEAVQEINDVALDFAETHLHKQIADGIPSSTQFYLRTKGKNRGYVEQNLLELSTKDMSEFNQLFGLNDK